MKTLPLDSKYAGREVYWSPDGRIILTDRTDDKEEAYFWDIETGKRLGLIKTFVKYCFDLLGTCIIDIDTFDFSPNGKILLSANKRAKNRQVKLLSPQNGNLLAEITDASGPAYWSPDGNFILAQDKQKDRIGIWRVSIK